jgi:DNA mismatch repair protein MSH6
MFFGTPILFLSQVVSRYWTPTLREEVQRLTELEERRDEMQREAMRRLFVRFASHYDVWMTAVRALAELDALLSLATYSANADGPMCRPVFVAFNAMQVDGDDNGHDVQSLELRGAWHPSVAATQARGSAGFIPNDIVLGSEENPARFVLVTGPNMGGKSTTLRLACIAVIMAQLGCYVPAVKCELTPVDRIFTRIGAHDRILAGQSTFFVELEETATILRSSTSASLVILDELGRGTSTFDGTAIAYAVIHHLKSALRCRCLFSTHYAMLTEEFADDPAVANYHMAYAVGADKESVTFLYRFVKGTCNKSHGMNVARLAGLPGKHSVSILLDMTASNIFFLHRFIGNSRCIDGRQVRVVVASGTPSRRRIQSW